MPAANSASALSTPERNRFYYGKLMDVVHCTKEQDYLNGKRWLLNRLVFGSGVVAGLGVVADAKTPGHVILEPGLAIDGQGREIVVPSEVSIDPTQLTDDQGIVTGATSNSAATLISIAYVENQAEPTPVFATDCDTPGACVNGTIQESYRMLVRLTADALPKPPSCGLAKGFPLPVQDQLQQLLAQRIAGRSLDLPDDPSVPLARFDANGVNAVADRPLVYGNDLLFELILCLVDQVGQLASNS